MTNSEQMNYAVGARRDSDRDGLDFFPTPPWATRALCEWIGAREVLGEQKVWEPACGAGHMALALREYFETVMCSDIGDYGLRHASYGVDFIGISASHAHYDWIITNPPFNLAEAFAERALKFAERGVALLVRTSFLEGKARFARLFSVDPPTDILQFTERVPMHKGRLLRNGSTATAYCWLVWRGEDRGKGARFHWIPPCRKRLECDYDYMEPLA